MSLIINRRFLAANLAAPPRGFWTDTGLGANIYRVRDRLLVGDAVDHTGTYTQTDGTGTWLKTEVNEQLRYVEKTSQFASFQTKGGIGGGFATRASDNGGMSTDGVPIGTWQFAYNDATGSRSVWASYHEARRITGAGRAFGIEVDVANEGNEGTDINAYDVGATTVGIGLWLASGGDNDNTNDNTVYDATAAMGIVSNTKKWRKGIIVTNNALVDIGSTRFIAMEMAQGHELRWKYSGGDNAIGGLIRSDGASAAGQSRIVFETDAFRIKGVDADFAERHLFSVVVPTLTSGQDTNRFVLTPTAVGGGLVTLAAVGADTNIDLALTPKGSGRLRFGTHAAVTTETVTGYITVKDAGGTERKIAVVSS